MIEARATTVSEGLKILIADWFCDVGTTSG
jgi:hypothetical protein